MPLGHPSLAAGRGFEPLGLLHPTVFKTAVLPLDQPAGFSMVGPQGIEPCYPEGNGFTARRQHRLPMRPMVGAEGVEPSRLSATAFEAAASSVPPGSYGGRGGNRTHTPQGRRILNPVRLPSSATLPYAPLRPPVTRGFGRTGVTTTCCRVGTMNWTSGSRGGSWCDCISGEAGGQDIARPTPAPE